MTTTEKKPRRPRLITIDNMSVPPPLTAFIYGHSKVGKTILASTAAEVEEMCPVLMIDCGTSSASVQGEPRFSNMDVIRMLEFDAISEIYTWLSPRGKNMLAEKGYRTIIIDEGDKLQRKALIKVMERNITVGDRHGKKRANLTDTWLEDFGEARDMTIGVYEQFMKFNTHFIATSLVRIKEDDIDFREYRMPSMPGQLRDDIPSMMALYIYLDVAVPTREDADAPARRVAYFSGTRKFKAGVWGPARAERFGAEMVDPTMRKIFDAYVGERT